MNAKTNTLTAFTLLFVTIFANPAAAQAPEGFIPPSR
jgi:hypothetical protein